MNATRASEVRAYLEAVRARLGDLPEEELRDLLDDLEQHLAEVAAEDEGSLEERLGVPEAYAAELRASVGLAEEETREGLVAAVLRGLGRSSLGCAAAAVSRTKPAVAVREFLPEARPGWWVLRGYLAVIAFAEMTTPFASHVPVPEFGSRFVGLAVVAFAIWASVALGRRAPYRRRVRGAIVTANVLIVLAAVGALDARPYPVYFEQVDEHRVEHLAHADGAPIANVCPYASDGTPLDGVLLFDQDGRPIVNTAGETTRLHELRRAQPSIANAFPLDVTAFDPETGERVAVECAPGIASEATSPSPFPSPTSTAGQEQREVDRTRVPSE